MTAENQEPNQERALQPRVSPVDLSVQRLLTSELMRRMLARHLGDETEAKKLAIRVAQAARMTPQLAQCTPLSIASAVLTIATERLDLGKEVYLIPRRQRIRGSEPPAFELVLHAQTSYHGELARVRRATGGKVVVRSAIIHADDDFRFEPSAPLPITHVSKKIGGESNPDSPWLGAWAYLLEGSNIHTPVVMSKAEIEAHRDQYVQRNQRGEIPGDSIWRTAPAAAWLKTVVRKAAATVGRGGLLFDLDEIQGPIEDSLNQELTPPERTAHGIEGTEAAIEAAEHVLLDEQERKER